MRWKPLRQQLLLLRLAVEKSVDASNDESVWEQESRNVDDVDENVNDENAELNDDCAVADFDYVQNDDANADENMDEDEDEKEVEVVVE